MEEAMGNADDANKKRPLGDDRRGVLLCRDRFARVRHVPFSAVLFVSIAFNRVKNDGSRPPVKSSGCNLLPAGIAILANHRLNTSFFCPRDQHDHKKVIINEIE
jgi:hypothetical protein